ncbi:best-5, partial [Symbiodinium natans]
GVQTVPGRAFRHVDSYNSVQLASSALCCVLRGTVLTNRVLWAEQLLLFLLYVCSWRVAVGFMREAISHGDDSVEVRITRHYTEIMTSLAGFLLAFYTSIAVSRWWRLRTEGIGRIWGASSQLMMLLAALLEEGDLELLLAIRRYARASLAIHFLRRRYPSDFMEKLDELAEREILLDSEVEKLREVGVNLAESVWTWVTQIVVTLARTKQMSEYMLTHLLQVVEKGRSGAACIGAQMGTPIPLQYVHLMGLLVKAHNVILACACGFQLAAMSHRYAPGISLRVFLTPFLYNGILLINAELADPFAGGVNAFSLEKYEKGIENDGRGYVRASISVPDCLPACRSLGMPQPRRPS